MKFFTKIGWFLLIACSSYGRTVFDGEFAPHGGLVSDPEKPFRNELCLNGYWDFQGVDLPAGWKPNVGQAPALHAVNPSGWDSVKIKIPSPWNVNSYQRSSGPDHHAFPRYPQKWENYKMAWMRKTVLIPANWTNQSIRVHFEAVAGFSEVYVNGQKVCENYDLFLPFEADITAYVTAGQPAEILVGVRHSSLLDDGRTVGRRMVPAGSMWGQHIAGIWQDVFLFALPKVRVQDVYVKPLVAEGQLELDVTVQNDTDQNVSVSVGGQVKPWKNKSNESILSAPEVKWSLGDTVLEVPARKINLAPGQSKQITLSASVNKELKLWSPDSPNLYGMVLAIKDSATQVDSKYQRFGWRQWTFDGTKHCLNGQPMELRGDSWHFQGIPQMTRRYAWVWFTAIKQANGNAVRLHAQVYPRFYMDMADEMGICVLAETANWASDGGPKFDADQFWKYSDEHLKRFVLRDRNHPCVFGWSLTNENHPIINNVFNRPDLMPVQIEAWARWVALCKELDPSRPWVSGDGDYDGDGTLPTVVGHYGDESGMRKWASHGKPWGVGEHSMAYYGTPKQVSKYNGERAYESVLGRMEGLAYECYDLISLQRKCGASYVSVFNIAWYSLKPLAFGLPDTTRPPTLNDGVFLSRPYVEGKPGVQPERIGPYCSTLNPGYDPALPLYETWPMFEAIRDANAPGGPAPSKWADVPEVALLPELPPKAQYESVVMLGEGASSLKARLASRGVAFDTAYKASSSSLTIVDGHYGLKDEDVIQLKQRLAEGGDVWIWGIIPQTAETFNRFLPQPVEVTNRKATSLLVQNNAKIVEGLKHSNFYFSEIQTTPAMEHGLTGPFVEQGTVILAACDTDWRRWNKIAESIKTAEVYRSEREKKPAGAALVVVPSGKGHILINTMTEFYQTDDGNQTLQAMLKNMGVPLRKVEMGSGEGVFDLDGNLKQALVCGPFGAESQDAAFKTSFLGDEEPIKPIEKMSSNGQNWVLTSTTESGDFNFKKMGWDGPMINAAAYISFWLWSPRPLDDLLIEPDMPKLDLVAGADDAHKIWLNGTLISEKNRHGPMTLGDIECKTLPLKQGWNHFMVKVVQGSGNWQFSAKLRCIDYGFLAQLKAAPVNPDQKGSKSK